MILEKGLKDLNLEQERRTAWRTKNINFSRFNQGSVNKVYTKKPTKDSISIEFNLVMTFLSITDLGDKHALALDKTNQYLNLNSISSVIVLFGEHVGLNWV